MASIDDVYEVVKDIGKKVDDLVAWKAGMLERCEAHREKTEELRETVYSNPSGLRDKVNSLWSCKREVNKMRDFWLGVLKGVVIVGIVAVITWFLFIYRTMGTPS